MLTIARPAVGLRSVEVSATSLPGKIGFAVMATSVVALAAHVSVPLPFSPVPLTLQPLAVLLVGLLLGPGLAFATMILYLCEGAAGLPVFSPLGPGGMAQLLGPTGGYLMSYPVAAAVTGWLVCSLRGVQRAFLRGLLASAAGTAIIFLSGATRLASLLHLTPTAATRLAVLPFLPSEAIKIVVAATFYSAFARRRQF